MLLNPLVLVDRMGQERGISRIHRISQCMSNPFYLCHKSITHIAWLR